MRLLASVISAAIKPLLQSDCLGHLVNSVNCHAFASDIWLGLVDLVVSNIR